MELWTFSTKWEKVVSCSDDDHLERGPVLLRKPHPSLPLFHSLLAYPIVLAINFQLTCVKLISRFVSISSTYPRW